MTAHQRAQKPISAARIARMNELYRAEFECWCIVQYGMDRFQLIRQPRPKLAPRSGKGSDSVTMTVVQCNGAVSYKDAERWLNIHRGRAAMRAALGAL
jgi:hypothetical protein